MRWLNHVSPWNQWKPSLGKLVTKYLDLEMGPKVHGGIQGQFCMRLDLSDGFERSIYLNCNNMVVVQVLRRLLHPGDVYVDAGANLGLLVLVASRSVGASGKAYAFEPQPKALERLRENLEMNGVKNTVIVPKGCWERPGTATLYEFADSSLDLGSMGKRPDKGVAREFAIETVRIDDVVVEPVKLFKLDVEGAEWGALRGAERVLFGRERPHLLVEVNQTTSQAFGYHPMEMVDWILERAPRYKLRVLKSKRMFTVTRNQLANLMKAEPSKSRNVWFEPIL